MDMGTGISAMELANVYARYFVQDFSCSVMKHLAGSHPVPEKDITSFIATESLEAFNTPESVEITQANVVGRFLYECAEHALASGVADPESQAVWNEVSDRPSIHHGEISSYIYESANLYKTTVDTTLHDVVARDAHTAARSIQQAANARMASTETGGSLHTFNWGILDDGLWLNGALLKAFDQASIFRQGEPVAAYWTQTAFNFARQNAMMLALDHDQRMMYSGELDVLISQLDQTTTNSLLADFSQANVADLLFSVGTLESHVRGWEKGLVNTTQLIQSIKQLSVLATLLPNLIEASHGLVSDGVISDLTVSRLQKVNDVVTLSLVGYEALRETKFADSLILEVTAQGNDPKVDVIVNNDLLNSYNATGGGEADLISFGTYLDPRRGIPAPGNGWSMEFIVNRRDDVIPQVMAEDSDRLERLRNNDAAAIQTSAINIINGVVRSYLDARQIASLRPDISQKIDGLARKITDNQTEVNLDMEITNILISVIDDPFLTQVSQRWLANLTAQDESIRANSAGYTIAQTAIADAIESFSADSED